MIEPMLRAALVNQLPPEQVDRISELIGEAVAGLSTVQMFSMLGELMAIQSLISVDLPQALHRATALAAAYDMHELLAYISELPSGPINSG